MERLEDRRHLADDDITEFDSLWLPIFVQVNVIQGEGATQERIGAIRNSDHDELARYDLSRDGRTTQSDAPRVSRHRFMFDDGSELL